MMICPNHTTVWFTENISKAHYTAALNWFELKLVWSASVHRPLIMLWVVVHSKYSLVCPIQLLVWLQHFPCLASLWFTSVNCTPGCSLYLQSSALQIYLRTLLKLVQLGLQSLSVGFIMFIALFIIGLLQKKFYPEMRSQTSVYLSWIARCYTCCTLVHITEYQLKFLWHIIWELVL